MSKVYNRSGKTLIVDRVIERGVHGQNPIAPVMSMINVAMNQKQIDDLEKRCVSLEEDVKKLETVKNLLKKLSINGSENKDNLNSNGKSVENKNAANPGSASNGDRNKVSRRLKK